MIRFWICPKKRKIRFWIPKYGFGFSQKRHPQKARKNNISMTNKTIITNGKINYHCIKRKIP